MKTTWISIFNKTNNNTVEISL